MSAGDELRRLKEEKLKRLERLQKLYDSLTSKQREVVRSKARYKTLLCGRRGGKTQLAARIVVRSLLQSKRGEWTIYAAIDLKHARHLIWSTLMGVIEELGLDKEWKINELMGTITTPVGGCFRLFGFNDRNEIDKLLGVSYRTVILDEVASYDEHLDYIVNTCVSPTIGEALDDSGKQCGQVILMGTPGRVMAGPWFEWTTKKKNGWENWHWTVRDNPKFADGQVDIEEWLTEERDRNGWTEEDARYRQQYLAIWCNDSNNLVVPIVAHGHLPKDWRWDDATTVLSIDYGFSPDPCAWTVIAGRKNDLKGRIVFSHKQGELDDIDFALVTKKLVDRFSPISIVGDTAGAGSRAMDKFNTKFGCEVGVWIKSAEKHDKLASINHLNTAFRKERLELVECDETQELSKELSVLQWKNSKRDEIHPLYPDHAFDSLRYGFNEFHTIIESVNAHLTPGRATNDDEAKAEMYRHMEMLRQRQAEDNEDMELMGAWR